MFQKSHEIIVNTNANNKHHILNTLNKYLFPIICQVEKDKIPFEDIVYIKNYTSYKTINNKNFIYTSFDVRTTEKFWCFKAYNNEIWLHHAKHYLGNIPTFYPLFYMKSENCFIIKVDNNFKQIYHNNKIELELTDYMYMYKLGSNIPNPNMPYTFDDDSDGIEKYFGYIIENTKGYTTWTDKFIFNHLLNSVL